MSMNGLCEDIKLVSYLFWSWTQFSDGVTDHQTFYPCQNIIFICTHNELQIILLFIMEYTFLSNPICNHYDLIINLEFYLLIKTAPGKHSVALDRLNLCPIHNKATWGIKLNQKHNNIMHRNLVAMSKYLRKKINVQ